MEDYEKLGLFYLGRLYDLAARQPKEELLLYDAKDLLTHAVCVGMTGSGKTGLGIALLEEAAIDGIPALIIDPKGDLGNLLLTFPSLRGEDFLPWVNADDARQKGQTPADYAAGQAAWWQKGLAEWGQDGARIQRFRDAVDCAIYTPGSQAGLPVSILKSFAALGPAVLEDGELLRERVGTTVVSLLGLLGLEADPLQSREYILLATLVEQAWRQGQDLDLGVLIQQVQTPPITKIGVLDLETFYPAKDRFALVMALNNLLASPGFAAWLEGEPLDIGQLLYTPTGKPRLAIFSLAHLGDAERMFFVSLLLNQVLGWMRAQSGTTSLRALLYMDEIFGYFPPVGNPPSKKPLLTLLKQARAFGLGVVLATQNPVDLDYKGLANAGTWFIGRLQTERDKARLLDGLEGAATVTGASLDRAELERILAGLGSRVFLMNNVHEDAPVVFQSRWALSYLRGPLSREQVRALMEARKAAPAPAVPAAAPATAAAVPAPAPTPTGTAVPATKQPPTLPPDITAFYLPVRGAVAETLVYQPRLLGVAKVHFSDAKAKVDLSQDVLYLTPITDAAIPVNWEEAEPAGITAADLSKTAQPGAAFAGLPPAASQAKNYPVWNRTFAAWLAGHERLDLLRSPSLGILSQPGEDERDFRIRLQQLARERRDAAVEALRQKYAPKLATLQERVRRAEQAVAREQADARQRQMQSAISIGATLLGAFSGRRALGRATTAARDLSRSAGTKDDIERATETLATAQEQLQVLQEEFQTATAALEAKIDPLTEPLEPVSIKPKKADITVQLVTLVWVPGT